MAQAEFARLQQALARYLRNPQTSPSPYIGDDRRLGIYRHAIVANVAGFMGDNFPRIKAVMSDEAWDDLLRDYLQRHESNCSLFVELPREFLAYLDDEWIELKDLPFLRELAHFDWLETDVGADQRVLEVESIDLQGDLLLASPVANPLIQMHTYRFPVHAIGPDYLPLEPPAQATRIAAFRDLQHRYGFLDLNPAASALLDAVIDNPVGDSGQQLATRVADDLGLGDGPAIVQAAADILERMRARGAILGTRP